MKVRLCKLAALALLFAVGCSGDDGKPKRPPEEVFEPIRIVETYLALLERPDAVRALFIGEEAKALTNYFQRAGVKTATRPEGRYDIVLIACDEMSEESCSQAKRFLSSSGVMAWLMDMRGVSADDFRNRLEVFGLQGVHFWMPGETRWMLTGRAAPRKVKLSSVLELFLRDGAERDLVKAGLDTPARLFANYVGRREEAMPAFEAGDTAAEVHPEYFLTKEIPAVDWLADEGVEKEIARSFASEMRSMQLIRRLVVEGNMLSARAVDKKGDEAAIERWRRAAKRNPHDPFLMSRLDRLSKTAAAFLSARKVLQAMKCYETMVQIRPTPDAVNNFGLCLKMIGKNELSEKVLKHAQDLLRQSSCEGGR